MMAIEMQKLTLEECLWSLQKTLPS